MPDPILPQLTDRIAAAIKAELPELRSCEGVAGRFDLQELEQARVGAPAVLVALLGLGPGKAQSGPSWHHQARFAAYVVTQDRAGLSRAAAALAIVDRLLVLVHVASWQGEDMGEAEGVAAENLYSSGAREGGLALWAVSWTQDVEVAVRPTHEGALPATWYAAGLDPDGPVPVIEGDAP